MMLGSERFDIISQSVWGHVQLPRRRHDGSRRTSLATTSSRSPQAESMNGEPGLVSSGYRLGDNWLQEDISNKTGLVFAGGYHQGISEKNGDSRLVAEETNYEIENSEESVGQNQAEKLKSALNMKVDIKEERGVNGRMMDDACENVDREPGAGTR
ncbi:hypothetical protein DPMN_017390 [Dreissena polymorpha]|uniref:Uncharacterized protein n=1 Tax=Dreissena polymorpha TaxID=45954 RepID=A0A9D4NF93_DREPO|nr:hypothetical protein DPMN_017390 [Dreissena polymorpha]